MKVHVANKNNTVSIHDAYSILTPLNFVLRIFGLCCISRDGTKLKYSWPIWKIIIRIIVLFILNVLSIYLNLEAFKQVNIIYQDYVITIYLCGYIQFVVDLVFVYKYGRQRCLHYYTIFENVDKFLGMPYYKEMKGNFVKMCIFFFFIGMLWVVSDGTIMILTYGWYATAFYTVTYLYTIIKMLSALDGISHLTQMKYRLKCIEDILEDYYCKVEILPDLTTDLIRKKDWTKTDNKLKHSLNTKQINHSNIILHLNRCYLHLLEQCDYINDIFGFRVLFGGLVYLLEMVMLINMIIRIIIGTSDASSFKILTMTLEILNYSAILLCAINRCEQNYKQSERIIRWSDHLITNKKITLEVKESLKEFKHLIITRPINFNAMNFYRLDYPALFSMASAIVTYTIILLQNIN